MKWRERRWNLPFSSFPLPLVLGFETQGRRRRLYHRLLSLSPHLSRSITHLPLDASHHENPAKIHTHNPQARTLFHRAPIRALQLHNPTEVEEETSFHGTNPLRIPKNQRLKTRQTHESTQPTRPVPNLPPAHLRPEAQPLRLPPPHFPLEKRRRPQRLHHRFLTEIPPRFRGIYSPP